MTREPSAKMARKSRRMQRDVVPLEIKRILKKYPTQAYSVLRRTFYGPDGNGFSAEKGCTYSQGKYKVIDLFAGAGGFTLGFSGTGKFEPVFANDFNAFAAKTYNANFGDHCIHGDINDLLANRALKFPIADIVIGGPPCQGFSLLNKQREGDPRKELWRTYLEVIRRVRPVVFVMENVPELLGSPEFSLITSRAEELGYVVNCTILNAADFGVPQRRKRAIVFGSKLGFLSMPEPTHADHQKKCGLFQTGVLAWETVWRAIGDLPEPEGTDIRVGKVEPPMDLHFGRNPTKDSLARYRCVPEGGNRFDLQKKRLELTPDCWIRKKSGGTDLFGRLWSDRPAFTIRTEFFKPEKGRYLHPRQHRPITHREAARLQSFPDTFIFLGTKIEVAKQIGNAVPPLLAKHLATAVLEHLSQNVVHPSS